ncbi:MAG: HNH endonuclease [Gammaproteobacteria bacterium]|nr:MAG: HNH endonuclease [Gammaproteobacteria bacterium]
MTDHRGGGRICIPRRSVGSPANGQGEVLNVGRKTRVIPTAIRRALRARDGGCQYPGCSQSRYVDGHHIVHWADGGETKLDNLVLICRRHHTLVHEFGYRIIKTATGFEFVEHGKVHLSRTTAE